MGFISTASKLKLTWYRYCPNVRVLCTNGLCLDQSTMSERLRPNNYEPFNPRPETSGSSDCSGPDRTVQQPPHNVAASHPTSAYTPPRRGSEQKFRGELQPYGACLPGAYR